MPVTRMRMRPWLEKMIESNAIHGLSWIDEEKTMFQIPWKHAARHGWEMDKDACLFKQWAIHTGKFSEGQASDPKTWKANFRCAMNSLPDIEEVKDKSINKGHGAMRVFRMLPSTPKCKDKRSKGRESKSRKKQSKVKTEEDTDYSDTQSPVSLLDETSSPQENTIDSTVQTDHKVCPFVEPNEVPDWTFTVEIGPDSIPSNFSHRFEVSPDHSPEYSDIIEICKELERDSGWRLSSDGIGFLGNEACNSPDSQWSDTSSELEDIRQYTTLCSNVADPTTDELLSSFSQQMLSVFH